MWIEWLFRNLQQNNCTAHIFTFNKKTRIGCTNVCIYLGFIFIYFGFWLVSGIIFTELLEFILISWFTPIVAKKLSLCLIWPWNQKTFGSSMWSAADLSQVWRCWFWIRAFFLDRTVTVYGKGRLDPWWFLRNFLSSDSLSLLLDFGKGMTHLKNMYLCTIVWTVLWKF